MKYEFDFNLFVVAVVGSLISMFSRSWYVEYSSLECELKVVLSDAMIAAYGFAAAYVFL